MVELKKKKLFFILLWVYFTKSVISFELISRQILPNFVK